MATLPPSFMNYISHFKKNTNGSIAKCKRLKVDFKVLKFNFLYRQALYFVVQFTHFTWQSTDAEISLQILLVKYYTDLLDRVLSRAGMKLHSYILGIFLKNWHTAKVCMYTKKVPNIDECNFIPVHQRTHCSTLPKGCVNLFRRLY